MISSWTHLQFLKFRSVRKSQSAILTEESQVERSKNDLSCDSRVHGKINLLASSYFHERKKCNEELFSARKAYQHQKPLQTVTLSCAFTCVNRFRSSSLSVKYWVLRISMFSLFLLLDANLKITWLVWFIHTGCDVIHKLILNIGLLPETPDTSFSLGAGAKWGVGIRMAGCDQLDFVRPLLVDSPPQLFNLSLTNFDSDDRYHEKWTISCCTWRLYNSFMNTCQI